MFTKIISFIRDNLFKITISILLTVVYLMLFILLYIVIKNKYVIKENKVDNKDIVINDVVELTNDEEEYIYIDIKGSIKKPNVYKLLKGSRVIDAIKASGGLLKTANTRFINLSKILNDGDVIVIYSNDEIKKAKKSNTIYVETPCVCEEIKNDACYNTDNNDSNNNNTSLININTATLDELMTLSGIGESKAKAIIEYRNTNGNFNSIEDIIKVSGISETIYAKIKNYITV